MPALLTVTLIWAFSFSLVGAYLSGVDSFFLTAVRLGLAFLCLLPFFRPRQLDIRQSGELLAIGGVQFGLMYVTYLAAFQYFEAYLVVLFSVFTPLWVTLIDGLIHRQAKQRAIAAAVLATAGALAIRAGGVPSGNFWAGFLLMQVANLAFAGGQVWFREWKRRHPPITEKEIFALPYLGGTLLALAALAVRGEISTHPNTLDPAQWAVLLYLGVIASGLGFYLWNYGASRVSTGFLAAANNLIVPLGILVALLWGRNQPVWPNFLVGTALIVAALVLARTKKNLPAS